MCVVHFAQAQPLRNKTRPNFGCCILLRCSGNHISCLSGLWMPLLIDDVCSQKYSTHRWRSTTNLMAWVSSHSTEFQRFFLLVFNKALTKVTQKFSEISIQYRFQTEKISQIAMLLSSTDFVVNQNIITRNLNTTDLQLNCNDKGYTEVCRYFLNLSAGWQELIERQNLLCKLLFCTSSFQLLHDHL